MNALKKTNYLVSGQSLQIRKYFVKCFCEAALVESKVLFIIDLRGKKINHKRAKSWFGNIIDVSKSFHCKESDEDFCTDLFTDKRYDDQPQLVYLHLNANTGWQYKLMKQKFELLFEKKSLDFSILFLHDGQNNDNILLDLIGIIKQHNVPFNMVSDDIFVYENSVASEIVDSFAFQVITKHKYIHSCEKIESLYLKKKCNLMKGMDISDGKYIENLFSANFLNNMSLRTGIVIDYSKGELVLFAY